MKVTVEMTHEEFREFLDWKDDREFYVKELRKASGKKLGMAKKVMWAVEADPKKPGKYKIADQDHAEELLDMAKDIIDRPELPDVPPASGRLPRA